MELAAAIERVERVVSTCADREAVRDDLNSALRASKQLAAFLAAADAELAGRLAAVSSFPEEAIAEVSRDGLSAASATIERSRTLEEVPRLAVALADADVTAAHVDVVTRAAKGIEPEQRDRLFARVEELVGVASHATVEQFGRRVRAEVRRIVADDGMSRLDVQRRATSLSSWTDRDGMWNVRARFDPVTAVPVSAALDRAVEALFSDSVPETCPLDPVEKQRHLRALALARLVTSTSTSGRPGRPEFVAVLELTGESATKGPHQRCSGGCSTQPQVTWPIPVEVPTAALAEMMHEADLHAVVVRDGVVLHAPGNLDLGRTTRLASRAQRRALRGLYATCAVPNCQTSFDRCKLHHVVWWRHGGRTDLGNLLPVCSRHHSEIHDAGWVIDLDSDRRLTITFPDGTIRNTGPPSRRVA